MRCSVRIGTSGWHYNHWRGPFYPPGLPAAKMLPFYLERFNTVEINNSFYRLPTEAALESWRESTPAGFCFAVKASRFLTHMKKLKDPQQGLSTFLSRVEILAGKLGPVLFQLPPGWGLDLERLEAFLSALPRTHPYAFEFRHAGWHVPAVYSLLGKYNVAFCIYDLAGFQSPILVTADIAYVRLHGPDGPYQGSYTHDALQFWATRIREWCRDLKGVYTYFDNDQAGFAAHNALELESLVRPGGA